METFLSFVSLSDVLAVFPKSGAEYKHSIKRIKIFFMQLWNQHAH